MREEHQASGISPEITELHQGLETLIEMTESAQIELSSDIQESKQKQSAKNKETAEEVRKRAMERLSQTKAREKEGQESATKKRRHSLTCESIYKIKKRERRAKTSLMLILGRENRHLRKRNTRICVT